MSEENPQPSNNWYYVPIDLVEFLECSDGGLLRGLMESKLLVQADSEAEAAVKLSKSKRYFDNWRQLDVEERARLRLGQPFIFREGSIEKILKCEHRYKNRNGDLTCGPPVYSLPDEPGHDDESCNTNGLYGMCCVEGYDVPEEMDCPYAKSCEPKETTISHGGVLVTISDISLQ